ncbi:MAG: alkaline phosphatase PhoX [Pseudomonadota bacterium]
MNKRLLALFPLTAVAAAVGLSVTGCGGDGEPAVVSVAFTETPVAATSTDMSKTYTTSVAKVTYGNGVTKDFPLSYNTLFSLQDKVANNAHPAGQLYDHKMNPLMDPYGKPLVAETPDANSLLNVDGNLFLVTHLEYDWILSNGAESYTTANWYSRAPTGMLLSGISQDKNSGKLSVSSQKPIDFSSVNGTWINCFGSQTPWNTHLGSEEDYDLQYNPLSSSYKTTTAGVKSMTELYFQNTKTANPYHYGFIPEVTVSKDGSTKVVKHYAMSRGTWEMAKVMPDGKTAYMGDDGTHGLMAMFVADKANDLSAGTIYAAKWNQTSDANGGVANLTWVKLGKSTDAEIKAIIDSGVTFSSIFDAVAASNGTCASGYTRVRTGTTSDECLKVKSGMEKAAAFLETRRYAALLGATTEFTKMEGIAVNAKDKKAYMAISAIRDSMTSMTGEPADHIKLKKVSSGATYTIDLGTGQKTINGGETIASDWVGTKMYVETALLGKDISADANGNTADVTKVANTDNVFFSEKMRTLFIGEDSGMHVNNYVWAYNVDTKKLVRILSSAAGAENTGLQVVDDMNGYAYIMSNNQHWGDLPSAVPANLKTELEAKINKFHAPVGYIGGMPAIK